MSVRAVVVDDEPAGREAVITLLAHEPDVELVGVAANGSEAIELVKSRRPDLLFLDVQMPGMDGFEVIDALNGDTPPGIVFVTAHDRHAIRAFEVQALDYLLKPFGRPRFHAAVSRALQRIAQNHSEHPRRIAVKEGQRVLLVPVETIDWIEACDDYIRLHCGTRSHLVAERMHSLEAMLNPRDFVRIHRSVIVRVDRVREMFRDSDGGGEIVLDGDVRLRVARGRWAMLAAACGSM